MNRITIIGNSGAGKSTLAIKIATALKLPIYHMDKILWKSGWERTPEEEFRRQHKEIISKEKWIFEGVAYKSTYESRFTRAEKIIYLDTPLETCVENARKRMEEEKIRPNPYVSDNCPYEGDIQDNIKVIELFHNEYRPMIKAMLKKFEEKTILLNNFDSTNEEDLERLVEKIIQNKIP